jgi:hypothetical protein
VTVLVTTAAVTHRRRRARIDGDRSLPTAFGDATGRPPAGTPAVAGIEGGLPEGSLLQAAELPEGVASEPADISEPAMTSGANYSMTVDRASDTTPPTVTACSPMPPSSGVQTDLGQRADPLVSDGLPTASSAPSDRIIRHRRTARVR